MESNTETVAKRARVGPRTLVLSTMIYMFLMIILCTSGNVRAITVFDKLPKLHVELIKHRNDNASESSIGFTGLGKLTFFVKNSKIKRIEGRRSCSTSYQSGNRVDGSPLVALFRRLALPLQAVFFSKLFSCLFSLLLRLVSLPSSPISSFFFHFFLVFSLFHFSFPLLPYHFSFLTSPFPLLNSVCHVLFSLVSQR